MLATIRTVSSRRRRLSPAPIGAALAGFAALSALPHAWAADTLKYTIQCSPSGGYGWQQQPYQGPTTITSSSTSPVTVFYGTGSSGPGFANVKWTITVQNLSNSNPYDLWVTSRLHAESHGNSDTGDAATRPNVTSGFFGDSPSWTMVNSYYYYVDLSNTKNVGLLGAAANPFPIPPVTQSASVGGYYGGPMYFWLTITPKLSTP